MSWYAKEQATPFDDKPLEGLQFLDGDLLARLLMQSWTENQKLPILEFPSGEFFELWESHTLPDGGIVHLFGEMDLPTHQTRNQAYESAAYVAEQIGYGVRQVGEHQLELHGFDDREHLLLTYENARLVNVERIQANPETKAKHPAHTLMTESIRESLPPLGSNEELGLDAPAPVKYFHVNGWTWYASEFDGEDIFFGLVSGFEVELGYFSLSELEAIGASGRTIPVERDLYYEPKTLRELMAYHRRA